MNAFAALIVEGIPGIGKSTLVDALIRRHVEATGPRRLRTVVHLAQTHTYGPLARAENAQTLTVAQNLEHLERIAGILEWLHAGVHEHTQPHAFVLVDTLHLTHALRPGVLSWNDVKPIDARLASIGCRLMVLLGADTTIRRRAIEGRDGTQFFDEYAVKFGRTRDELHVHFAREQDAFASMAGVTEMRALVLYNDGETDEVLERAYAFWRGA